MSVRSTISVFHFFCLLFHLVVLQIRSEFETLLDPQQARKACVASIVTFDLPKEEFLNFHNLPFCQPSIIPTALSNFCAVWKPPPPKPPLEDETENLFSFLLDADPDAFTFYRSIKFGSKIEPVSPKQFDTILNRLNIPRENLIESLAPSIHTKLIQSHSVLIYEDVEFQPNGLGGFRVIILGDNRKGCCFQAEIYSNFCGGPYASFACGMG